ncbi:uncharacterized protein [Argopecten irradians]|uniref:uncharacterized protein isoform X1 n=1 Tax=Argopecten irradians TaxID=31199 RepID=UPI0037163F18
MVTKGGFRKGSHDSRRPALRGQRPRLRESTRGDQLPPSGKRIAALVTESWFIAGKKGTGIGLFEINSKGDIFVGPSPAICFFIYMALSLFGCLCNVISIVYCIVEVFLSTRNQHRCFVKVQALIWFLSGVIAISLLIWMSKSVIHTEIGFDGTRREIHSGSSFYLGCGAAAANLFAAIVIISVNVNREIEDDTSRLNSEGPEVMMGPTGSRTTGNTSYPLNDIPGQSSLPLSGLSDTIPLEVSENASRMYFQTAIKGVPSNLYSGKASKEYSY